MPACWFRPIRAHAAVVANKTVSLNVTQPGKVVQDKSPFVCEVVANRPHLCIGCLPNLLLRMHRNGHYGTSA